jgi:uncharacterized protein (DUF169 family)
MQNPPWAELASRLGRALKLTAEPIGIAFLDADTLCEARAFDEPIASPNDAGRTGSVPAGCVFWIKAPAGAFTTSAADHANCSVGSYTHGFLTLAEAARKDDVAAVLASGWVKEADVAAIPRVAARPDRIVYGPLAALAATPDVVLLRITGLALMTLKDAFPALRIEGKPQCHIVAIAHESGELAASVGCALSRARTGMKAEELTCALPARRLPEIVAALEAAAELDRAMARYASADRQRFDPR